MGKLKEPGLLQKHLLLEKASIDLSLGWSRAPIAILIFIMKNDFRGVSVQISRKELAKGIGLSEKNESAMSKHIRKLEAAGYICVDRNFDCNSMKHERNRYHVNYPPARDTANAREKVIEAAANTARKIGDYDWEQAVYAAEEILKSLLPPNEVSQLWRLIYDSRQGGDEFKRLVEEHIKW